MKHHQDAHAGPFEHVDYDVSDLLGKRGSDPVSKRIVNIQEVPPDVGQRENYGNDGIRTSFSPKSVCDFPTCLLFSVDRSLGLVE